VLEVAASSIVGGGLGFLARVVSTIAPSVFSEVVVCYRDYNFQGLNPMGDSRHARSVSLSVGIAHGRLGWCGGVHDADVERCCSSIEGGSGI